MTKKRLAFKDYQKLRRLVKAIDKKNKEYRDWVEAQADKIGCYVDKWFPRVGYYLGDDEKRVKIEDETTTKEARRRRDEIDRLAERADALLLKLAETHNTYPDLIDVKTGKVEIPEKAEVLEDAGEEEAVEPNPDGASPDTAGS